MPLSSTRKTRVPLDLGKPISQRQVPYNLAGGTATHFKQAPRQLLSDPGTTMSNTTAARVL